MWSADASNYRHVPIGVVSRATPRTWPPRSRSAGSTTCRCCRWRRARRSRARPSTRRWCSTSPGERDRRDRPRGPHRPRPARRGAGRAARRRPPARPDVRPRPVHPQPLHARRDDRQQRLRVALGGLGQDRRQRAHARRPHLPGRPAHGRAAARGRSAAAGPGRPARPGACAPSFPELTRRVSGYNLDQLLPENGFDLARALVGTEGTCVTMLEATVRLVESPGRPGAGRARLPGRLHRGRPRHADPGAAAR